MHGLVEREQLAALEAMVKAAREALPGDVGVSIRVGDKVLTGRKAVRS